jgi:cell division protein FtsL
MWARTRAWVVAILGLAIFGTALEVVYLKHSTRKLFGDLQSLERERDALNVEWGQLQLEQSTWATHGRIEAIARDRLGLQVPPAESIVLVTP